MNLKTIQTITHCVALLLFAFLINSCGTDKVSKPSTDEIEITKAEKLIQNGQAAEAADIYWELSESSPSPKKEQYQLHAIELLIKTNNYALAQQRLNLITDSNLTPELLTRKRMAQAAVTNYEGKYDQTLSILPVSIIDLSPKFKSNILELRAQAFDGLGNTFESLETRIELSDAFVDQNAFDKNQMKIWSILTQASEEQLNDWLNTTNAELIGWISLAKTMRAPYANTEQLNYAIDQWRYNYSNHSVNKAFIDAIVESHQNFFVIPKRIALLLPMSGRFEKIADVIRAGISSARTLNNDSEYEPELVLYDTGDNPADINYYYDLAVREGADFVIGPLKKAAVEILAKKPNLTIPILTLNYLPPGQIAPSNMFQFGLLPEDEASQVAERSSLDDRHNAIVLAPVGEWGSRLAEAFESRYTELDGLVINTQFYSPKDTDFSVPLKLALQLDQSEGRYRELRSVLGQNLEFEPRRRQDVDMIFLVASPRVARLMRPQINYYFATDLPVYSTSHVFTGVENITQDRDLEDVIYLDIPWILDPSDEQELLAEFLELEAGDSYQLLPRFAALGVDAYYLPLKLAELSALPHERYDGLTGKLSIQERNKIYRQLNWAVFKNGQPNIIQQFNIDTSSQP